jgi:N-ethylmaleimide reductase
MNSSKNSLMTSIDINLFSPAVLGPYELPNRIVMSAMTRCRAGKGNVPQKMNAIYYSQRASAGLIITEASQVSQQGIGYIHTPGIHTPEQVEGWKLVTDAVHSRNGRVFLQLFHCGRISHSSFQDDRNLPVAPSAVRPEGEVWTYEGKEPFETPRELSTPEIQVIIDQFRAASEKAYASGFDGVEIHAANGYLPDQFLQDGTNKRTDRYGGSIANRSRFILETTEAVVSIWGSDRVGVHISPCNPFNNMHDSNPEATFLYLVKELNHFNLAYLNVVEINLSDPYTYNASLNSITHEIQKIFKGLYITNGGYDFKTSESVLASGYADIVAYGRLFLANPDLPERFVKRAPLNTPDTTTFYFGGEKGYIDYPFLGES